MSVFRRSRSARVVVGVVVAGVGLALAGGCTSDRTGSPPGSGAASGTATPAGPPAPTGWSGSHFPSGAACPVTVPQPVPATEPWRGGLFGADSAHGNGQLWVGGLGAGGVIDAGPENIEKDGSVRMKFGWWRAVTGTLRITGRRVDGGAPALRAYVPGGYGDTGFQSSGVYFPTPGCWEVSGQVGTANLRFVTLVRTQIEAR